jgi:large subunit ribosomal protein L12e
LFFVVYFKCKWFLFLFNFFFRLIVKHEGNIPFDEIVAIARIMRNRSMANKFSGTVKEILGTAQSVGCQVDGMNPHAIIEKIDSGEYSCPEK